MSESKFKMGWIISRKSIALLPRRWVWKVIDLNEKPLMMGRAVTNAGAHRAVRKHMARINTSIDAIPVRDDGKTVVLEDA